MWQVIVDTEEKKEQQQVILALKSLKSNKKVFERLQAIWCL